MSFFSLSADSVKAKDGCVFVHCHAGISRSATICIAYIMKTMQWDLSKAYEFVKERRPCISPNLHFMGQLLEFQKRLQESGESLSGAEKDLPDGTASIEEESLDDLSSSSAHSGLYYDVTLTSYDCPSVAEEPKRAIKPKTLPLFQKSKSHCSRSSGKDKDKKIESEFKPHLNSISLPNTPISQSKNHLPASHSPSSRSPACPSPTSQRTCHPLQFSPCGVVATLGSRSDTSLNFYHTPLAESM